MKRFLIISNILLFSVFMSMGQSLTLTPTINNQNSAVLFGNGSINYSGYRGGSTPGSAAISGSTLVSLRGYGYTGANFSSTQNVQISLNAAEPFSPTANGTNIGFWTTQIGTQTLSEKMFISDNGSVGIGTNSFNVGEKFAVKSGTTQFGIYPGYLDGVPNQNWTTFEMPFTKGLRVWDNFSVNGNTGILIADAFATLDVARGTAPLGTARFNGTQWNTTFNQELTEKTYIQSGKDESTVVINRFGEGTETSIGGETIHGYELEIHPKTENGLGIYNTDDSHRWELYVEPAASGNGGGDLALWADGSPKGFFDRITGLYTVGSDRKLKKNIKPLENVLEKVIQLKPSKYQYISNNPNGRESIGFIAQEVEPIFPQLVGTSMDKEGNITKTMNYSNMSVIAIKAIQEQQVLIEKLQQEYLDLKSEEKLLEVRLQKVETLISGMQSAKKKSN
ncbi:MAG TPA: tail fiber domain-containing protein [Leadbetterella sp.]|nr:tail fiber domain-containing protein [Leadbetterella sp.]